jgi:hypothetical protein|tara:strand:+ start:169 stop:402 length:234 start_codon:yes stop_codon:yes gene_type:complete
MKTKKNEPLSRDYLLKRGTCCHNKCFNCPYKPKTIKMEKHPYYDSDHKRQTEAYAMQTIALSIALGILICIVSIIIG